MEVWKKAKSKFCTRCGRLVKGDFYECPNHTNDRNNWYDKECWLKHMNEGKCR